MKKTALIALVALTACTAKAPLSLRVVESEMVRCPEATFLDGQGFLLRLRRAGREQQSGQ